MLTLGNVLRTVVVGGVLAAGIATAEDPGPSRGADFSYAKLEALIREHDIKTVDELLPRLPEDYRKFYLFVYESRSAQAPNTFTDSPRTILYGQNATFIMAFTKDPKAAPAVEAPDNVETIQWNAETKKFEFRELVFGEGKNPVEIPPEVNPLKCQACHGKDPRPNWDPYNIWAGSFGSVSRLGCDTMQAGTEELRKYQEFMDGNRKRDRYAHLPTEMSTDGKCPDDPAKEVTFRNAAHLDPNALFTQKVVDLNYQRLARLVMQSPRYQKLRPFLAAQSNHCVDANTVEEYFPQGYAKTEGFLSHDEALADVVTTGKLDFAQRLARFSMNNKGSAHEKIRQPVNFLDPEDAIGGMFSHRQQMAMVRLFADRLRVSMNRWAPAFTDGQYDFATPSGGPSGFFQAFRPHLAEFADKSCDELKAMSIAGFGTQSRK